MYLSALMLGAGRREGFEELAALVGEAQPTMASWARALGADRAGDHDAVRRHCAEILAVDDTALNTRRLAASAAAHVGDHADAARLSREVCERIDEPGNDEWLVIEHATQANDWESVRWAGARIGMEFASAEGSIDEEWGYVWIRPTKGAEDGSDDLQAIRTGPVTARISTVTAPEAGRQRRGDLIVFNAKPVEPRPADDEPGHEEWEPVFFEQTVLKEGGMQAWPVFGVDPGEEAWRAAAADVFARGWMLWRTTGPGREIVDEAGVRSPGVYGLLAAPGDVAVHTVAGVLSSITASWPGVVVWPALLEAVADTSGTDEEDPVLEGNWTFWNAHNFV
jgi:hypothetical protein